MMYMSHITLNLIWCFSYQTDRAMLPVKKDFHYNYGKLTTMRTCVCNCHV